MLGKHIVGQNSGGRKFLFGNDFLVAAVFDASARTADFRPTLWVLWMGVGQNWMSISERYSMRERLRVVVGGAPR